MSQAASQELEDLWRRFDALGPLAGDVEPDFAARLLAEVAGFAHKRLRLIADLLARGEDAAAALLTRTLFEWAALAVYLATDEPEQREERARRFDDYRKIQVQHAVEVVAGRSASAELKASATRGEASEVVRLRAKVAAQRNQGGGSTTIYEWMLGQGKGLRDLLETLPDLDQWLFWYQHTYWELSTHEVHPSPGALRERPHPGRPPSIALEAAVFSNLIVEAACSVNKRERPRVGDVLERIAKLAGEKRAPSPAPPFEPPEAQALASVCREFGVRQLSLFGSAVREELGWASDVDVLVEMEPTARPSLMTLARLRQELSRLFHRHVDVVLSDGLKPALRHRILQEARRLYGAV